MGMMKIKKHTTPANAPYKVSSPLFKKTISRGLTELNIPYSGAMIDQMVTHAVELLDWNAKTNLTAITEPHEVALKHLVDSAAAWEDIPQGAKVLDLGSGGGFPGIPLKILKPSIAMTLVDASRKKVSFLKHVVRQLALDRIEAVNERGENLALDPAFRGQYDVVISRAFSGVDTFVPMALPFLKIGGVLIAMKGKDYEHEEELFSKVRATQSDGSEIKAEDMTLTRKVYSLPFIESSRALLLIRVKNLG